MTNYISSEHCITLFFFFCENDVYRVQDNSAPVKSASDWKSKFRQFIFAISPLYKVINSLHSVSTRISLWLFLINACWTLLIENNFYDFGKLKIEKLVKVFWLCCIFSGYPPPFQLKKTGVGVWPLSQSIYVDPLCI